MSRRQGCKTTWEIYEIQHRRGLGYPVTARYQFVDGHGKRRHFNTKARAKLERDKAKALFVQEGKLAAGMLCNGVNWLSLIRGFRPPFQPAGQVIRMIGRRLLFGHQKAINRLLDTQNLRRPPEVVCHELRAARQ